jgi:hypothetical protein
MMRVTKLAWLCGLLLLLLVTVAAAADHHLTGKWVLDVKLGDGQDDQATLDLKDEGGKITYSGALGSVPVTGTATGDQVEIKLESVTPCVASATSFATPTAWSSIRPGSTPRESDWSRSISG